MAYLSKQKYEKKLARIKMNNVSIARKRNFIKNSNAVIRYIEKINNGRSNEKGSVRFALSIIIVDSHAVPSF